MPEHVKKRNATDQKGKEEAKKAKPEAESSAQTTPIDIVMAHRSLRHLPKDYLKRLSSVSKGLQVKGTIIFCKDCTLAKKWRRPLTSRPERSTVRLRRIHMDVSIPHPILVERERYFLLLLDKATRERWVTSLKQKSDVLGAIGAFL